MVLLVGEAEHPTRSRCAAEVSAMAFMLRSLCWYPLQLLLAHGVVQGRRGDCARQPGPGQPGRRPSSCLVSCIQRGRIALPVIQPRNIAWLAAGPDRGSPRPAGVEQVSFELPCQQQGDGWPPIGNPARPWRWPRPPGSPAGRAGWFSLVILSSPAQQKPRINNFHRAPDDFLVILVTVSHPALPHGVLNAQRDMPHDGA